MTHDNESSTAPTPLPTAEEVTKQLESLAVFDQWMDEQLERLVAEWIHTAAPNSQRINRSFSSRR
jgi:hypothetical protein